MEMCHCKTGSGSKYAHTMGPGANSKVKISIQPNKRLRFIGFSRRSYHGAGGQFESENISGCVARRFTKISGIVAGDEPGPWTEYCRYLTKGI